MKNIRVYLGFAKHALSPAFTSLLNLNFSIFKLYFHFLCRNQETIVCKQLFEVYQLQFGSKPWLGQNRFLVQKC